MEKNQQSKFCCYTMEEFVNNYDKATPLIEYRQYSRSYGFLLSNNTSGTHQRLLYCPWCGTKLPKRLGEEWCTILEKEYGIIDPFDEDKGKVPPEFWADEWWKKRGL